MNLDEDLDTMTREQLLIEVRRLRTGIREHHDCTGQELCWHHPDLWSLLPETTDPVLTAISSRLLRLDAQLPQAPRTSEEFSGPNK